MEKIVILGFSISSITFAISVTSIFLWLRELISKLHPKLEELIHCPFCLSFWLTNLFLILNSDIVYRIGKNIVYNWIVTVFFIMALSGVIHYVLLRTYKPIGEYMAQRILKKLKAK